MRDMIRRIKLYDNETGRALHPQCPFGIRDLHTDECYSGNGKNRCEYFVKYDHYMTGETTPFGEKVRSCMSYICCKCDKPIIGQPIQLSLF